MVLMQREKFPDLEVKLRLKRAEKAWVERAMRKRMRARVLTGERGCGGSSRTPARCCSRMEIGARGRQAMVGD